MHAYTTRNLIGLLAYTLAIGGILGFTFSTVVPYPERFKVTSDRSVPAITEDSPGWDGLRQGNRTAQIDGVLVTSLEGMPPPSDPYGRCVWLLSLPERLLEPSLTPVCESIRENLG